MTVSINWIMSGFTMKHLQEDKKCRKEMEGGLNLDQAALICRKSAGDFLLLQHGHGRSFRNLGVQLNDDQVTLFRPPECLNISSTFMFSDVSHIQFL